MLNSSGTVRSRAGSGCPSTRPSRRALEKRAAGLLFGGLVVGALAACQGSQGDRPGLPGREPALQRDGTQRLSASKQLLYVATLDQIDVYALGTVKPRNVIKTGLFGVTQLAIDDGGLRYASNFGTQSYTNSSVTEYKGGLLYLTRTNGAFSASGVAVAPSGDVFASSYYRNLVSLYHAGAADPYQQLQGVILSPGLLAFAKHELYVGEAGSAQILRFPTGATTPDLTLKVVGPGSLPPGAITDGGPFVVGKDGTVYAAGAVTAGDVGYEEFVDVFAPGQASPRTGVVLSTGRSAGSAPYIAVRGSSMYATATDINAAFQYEVGAKLKVVRSITNGLNQPGPIAVDGNGNLYIGNAAGAVTVYPPGATSPSQTIALPESTTPVAVVIGP